MKVVLILFKSISGHCVVPLQPKLNIFLINASERMRVVFNVLHAQNWLKDGAFTFNVYDAVAMSYLMKNVGRSSAKESDWTNSKLATDGQAHIHLPAPVYCPDVGGQLNHPPPNRARVCH